MSHKVSLVTFAACLLALQGCGGRLPSPVAPTLPVDRARDPALDGLRQRCVEKNVQACLDLAQLYWSGKGTGWVDRTRAARVFLQGCRIDPRGTASRLEAECEAGNPLSCEHRGRMVAYTAAIEPGATRDDKHALQLFEKACTGGSPDGCIDLGMRLACPSGRSCYGDPDGASLKRNRQRARTILQKQCDLGQPVACTEIVTANPLVAFVLPTTMDDASIRLLERACNELSPGDPAACGMLVDVALQSGHRLKRRSARRRLSEAKAMSYLRRGCELGFSNACNALKVEDPKGTASIVTHACESSARACTLAGFMHAMGEGVEPDKAEAARLFARGCDGADDGSACFGLGVMYVNGDGVPQDNGKALEYLKRGCELRFRQACEAAQKLEEALKPAS